MVRRNNFFWIAAAVVVLDQLLKYVMQSLPVSFSLSIIPNFLSISLIHNYGAGFGILQNQRLLLILVSLIVLGAIAFYFRKVPEETLPITSISLIAGGAFGNLIDRIFRGYVVDFIDFRWWPAFNIADSALSIGVILLLYYFWISEKKEAKKKI